MDHTNPNESARKYRLLLVDDQVQNLKVLGHYLYENGYDFAFATNGQQAIEMVGHNLPDLILLDISMPEMDGFTVCRKLKENPETEGIPIIFLTAKIETSDIVKGFDAGAVDYITKPFNSRELLARISTHLQLQDYRKMAAEQNRVCKEQNLELAETNKLLSLSKESNASEAERLKAMNEQLLASEEKLKHTNAQKDRFFSIISHDLRGPLGAIKLQLEMISSIADQLSKDEIVSMIQTLEEAANRTFALLENLLHWSRVQQGREEFLPESIELSSLVEDSISLHSINSLKKEITIIKRIPEDLYVLCDGNMISTVVRNLLSNAIKFTPTGGQIVVMAGADGDNALVSVADTGVGMDEESIEKLFRIDVSFTMPGTENEKGTGLGLILCKEYVERNGGTIAVSSTVGLGTAFRFTIPLSQEGPKPGIIDDEMDEELVDSYYSAVGG